MRKAIIILVSIYCSSSWVQFVSGQNCNGTQEFVKISKFKPNEKDLVLLYTSPQNAVTIECLERCNNSNNCKGLFVDYSNSTCFRVDSTIPNENSFIMKNISQEVQSIYFNRSCLQVPKNCSNKLWVLEKVFGFELVGVNATIVYNISDGLECAQMCLIEKRFTCRSAKYSSDKKCFLSGEDRRTKSEAYRATSWGVEYWENQCVMSSFPNQDCSFEEFPNSTMCCGDNLQFDVTQSQCQTLCVNEQRFTCRGLTYIPTNDMNNQSKCLMHGEDTISAGPRALRRLTNAIYLERVPCLDLEVSCAPSLMTVTLHTRENFAGRIYVNGHSEMCNADGRGGRDTALKIPFQLSQGRQYDNCGVMIARALGDTMNRTLVSAVVIIQHNQIIQQRGDRAIKIGCLLDYTFPKNVTVGASITFTGTDTIIGTGTVIVNASGVPPVVRVRIVDLSANNKEANETQLGQELQFRIDVDPENGSYDIMSGHLVARSFDGTESYLLLDANGCPPDPQTFPALQKESANSKSLVANFRAFKFPRSPIVRFTVMVHFCAGTCQPVDCGNGIMSYGRRKRNVPTVPSEINDQSLYQELALEFEMVVHTPKIVASSLSTSEPNNSRILVMTAGPTFTEALCLDLGAILGTVVVWLIIQFLILLGCYIAFNCQRKQQKVDEHRLKDDFPSYENSRHVHWADQET